jgi:hypothetical protein
VEHGWHRPARARVALGGEPPRRHEQYAIISLEPEPQQDQVPGILQQVSEFLEHNFHVDVVSSFPSPLGLGLFRFANPVQREELLDASPINFGQWVMSVHKHDEAPRNFRTCNYIRESWIMFLAFPLDYQTQDFIQAAVAPFGRLIRWFEGPNKSRVIARCLLLSPDRVPRSMVVSQGTMLGGAGRSWTVPVFILNGNFPDGFPHDEDQVPVDGNPHPVHGEVQLGHIDGAQGWQQDLNGAGHHVHADFGLNDQQMADVQQQLQAQPVPPHELAGWDAWPDVDQQQENEWQEEVDQVMEEPVQQQDSVTFDQSGSTAEYLRAHGPDIVLNVEDVLSGKFKTGSSSSTSSDASSPVHPEVQSMYTQLCWQLR